jgi:hypothetical protein
MRRRCERTYGSGDLCGSQRSGPGSWELGATAARRPHCTEPNSAGRPALGTSRARPPETRAGDALSGGWLSALCSTPSREQRGPFPRAAAFAPSRRQRRRLLEGRGLLDPSRLPFLSYAPRDLSPCRNSRNAVRHEFPAVRASERDAALSVSRGSIYGKKISSSTFPYPYVSSFISSRMNRLLVRSHATNLISLATQTMCFRVSDTNFIFL